MKLDIIIRDKMSSSSQEPGRKLLFNVKEFILSDNAKELKVVFSGGKEELIKVDGADEYICVYPTDTIELKNMKIL